MKTSQIFLTGISILMLACSPEATKQYIKPVAEKTNVTVDPNAQYFDPSVDILFVIDNSGSMDSHQKNLATNVDLFIQEFTKNSILDYHIGVVTTEMDYCLPNPKPGTCGALFGDRASFVDRTTKDIATILAENMMVGTSGSATEKSFGPVLAALSPALQNSSNKGFYRETAPLAIVFITDAEDQTDSLSEQVFYQQLLNLKKNDVKKILAYGVYLPLTSTIPCSSLESTPYRLESFLNLVGRNMAEPNQFSLCDPQFGQRIAEIGKSIATKVSTTFYLTDLPVLESIRVTYGSALLPKDPNFGWMYDPGINAVLLGNKIDWKSQPSGSKVLVTYDKAKLIPE